MEDWIDIIRQRLQEAESPLPPDDWEAFEASALPAKRPRVLPWAISALAVAAVAAILLIPGLIEESVPEQPFASVERAEPDAPAAIAEVRPPVSTVRPSAPSSTPVVRKPTAVPAAPTRIFAEETDAADVVQDEPAVEPTVSQETKSSEENVWEDVFESEQPSDAKAGRRMAVSPYIGSTGNLSRTFEFTSLDFKEHYTFAVDPYDGSMESWQIRHSLPLSFGLEISCFPTSRLALTSGLEFSVYNSVFSAPVLGEKRQRVHYLGIPLKANWVAWQSGRFSAWLGAGGKADRCIRARVDDKAFQDNTLNWSVMADASLQMALTNNLGLYIQPEVSWYFKPANPVLQTYRTEHPLMFTVGAGLRIGF